MNKKRLVIIAITLPIVVFLIWYGIQDRVATTSPTPTPPISSPTSITPLPTLPNFQQIVEPTTTNQTYQIDYYPKDESYFITVLATPYEKYRLEAEAALVKKFGLSQAQACALKLSISMPYFVDNQIEPTFTTFSFCPTTPLSP